MIYKIRSPVGLEQCFLHNGDYAENQAPRAAPGPRGLLPAPRAARLGYAYLLASPIIWRLAGRYGPVCSGPNQDLLLSTWTRAARTRVLWGISLGSSSPRLERLCREVYYLDVKTMTQLRPLRSASAVYRLTPISRPRLPEAPRGSVFSPLPPSLPFFTSAVRGGTARGAWSSRAPPGSARGSAA